MIEKKYAIGYNGGTKNNLLNLILIRKYVTFINKNLNYVSLNKK